MRKQKLLTAAILTLSLTACLAGCGSKKTASTEATTSSVEATTVENTTTEASTEATTIASETTEAETTIEAESTTEAVEVTDSVVEVVVNEAVEESPVEEVAVVEEVAEVVEEPVAEEEPAEEVAVEEETAFTYPSDYIGPDMTQAAINDWADNSFSLNYDLGCNRNVYDGGACPYALNTLTTRTCTNGNGNWYEYQGFYYIKGSMYIFDAPDELKSTIKSNGWTYELANVAVGDYDEGTVWFCLVIIKK